MKHTADFVMVDFTEEDHKRAALYAAAPELLEALKQLADDKGSAYWTPSETRQIARAAIAKAERGKP